MPGRSSRTGLSIRVAKSPGRGVTQPGAVPRDHLPRPEDGTFAWLDHAKN